MKEKIIGKYFKFDNLFYKAQSNLIDKGINFITRKLIDTQERKYFINKKEVTEKDFFNSIYSYGEDSTIKNYFADNTYMSIGGNIYNKQYRNTLSLHQCVELYKQTLDDIDKYILKDVSDEHYCNNLIKEDDWLTPQIPDMEWKGKEYE